MTFATMKEAEAVASKLGKPSRCPATPTEYQRAPLPGWRTSGQDTGLCVVPAAAAQGPLRVRQRAASTGVPLQLVGSTRSGSTPWSSRIKEAEV